MFIIFFFVKIEIITFCLTYIIIYQKKNCMCSIKINIYIYVIVNPNEYKIFIF